MHYQLIGAESIEKKVKICLSSPDFSCADHIAIVASDGTIWESAQEKEVGKGSLKVSCEIQ